MYLSPLVKTRSSGIEIMLLSYNVREEITTFSYFSSVMSPPFFDINITDVFSVLCKVKRNVLRKRIDTNLNVCILYKPVLACSHYSAKSLLGVNSGTPLLSLKKVLKLPPTPLPPPQRANWRHWEAAQVCF